MFSFCPKKNRTEHGPDQKNSRTNFVVLIRVLNKIGRTRTCSDRSDSVGHGYLYHILYILLDFLSTICRITSNSDELGPDMIFSRTNLVVLTRVLNENRTDSDGRISVTDTNGRRTFEQNLQP